MCRRFLHRWISWLADPPLSYLLSLAHPLIGSPFLAFFFFKIALGQMGIFVWDIQNESATPSDCQVIEGIPWIAVAFHSVCFLLMPLAQTPKFAWMSPISPVLQARAEWAACVLTASESNNWQNVVISISGSYPAFQRFLIFLSHRQTIFVSFWTIIVEVTWDQALFSFRFENYIPAGQFQR